MAARDNLSFLRHPGDFQRWRSLGGACRVNSHSESTSVLREITDDGSLIKGILERRPGNFGHTTGMDAPAAAPTSTTTKSHAPRPPLLPTLHSVACSGLCFLPPTTGMHAPAVAPHPPPAVACPRASASALNRSQAPASASTNTPVAGFTPWLPRSLSFVFCVAFFPLRCLEGVPAPTPEGLYIV